MEEVLKQILSEIKGLHERMDNLDRKIELNHQETKENFQKIMKQMDKHHIENINADNMLMNELQMIKIDQDYLFDKVNDNERELNRLKRQ